MECVQEKEEEATIIMESFIYGVLKENGGYNG
jgi:hypothetical protein